VRSNHHFGNQQTEGEAIKVNGSRARAIRKKVYGDMAFRQPMQLKPILQRLKDMVVKNKDGVDEKVKVPFYRASCTGLRAKYREAKKIYKTTGVMPR
jgi:hypothetical protein